jgi:hypothetical protein
MFKYLSDILSKFTSSQRLIVLGLILFTTIVLTLGNSVLTTYSNSDKILKDKIERLELSQSVLLNKNDSLYLKISESEIQCARDIMEVRRKILEDLDILERNVSRSNYRQIQQNQSSYVPNSYVDVHGDTIMVLQSAPEPIQIIDNTETMLGCIKDLKEKIKKDLK